jgi:hypothetical protein
MICPSVTYNLQRGTVIRWPTSTPINPATRLLWLSSLAKTPNLPDQPELVSWKG